ncbi:plasmid pRiA4b ORF-3 family protein [Thermodesulfobacteriota bacterium]
MPARDKPRKQVYQLKVTLRDIKPPVWHRVHVSNDSTLYEFHEALQILMGWTDSHLHEFMISGTAYGDPEIDPVADVEDETVVKLDEIVSKEKERFHYRYDFGDCWDHEVVVEKILPVEKGIRYPFCVAGERACPPEDCGGAPGYAELLAALGDPSHPDHDHFFAWLPGDFDSEKFDAVRVNKGLRTAGGKRRKART